MFDAGSPCDSLLLQRAEGTLIVTFRARCGMTVLDTLHQAGCLKARFPRQAPREWAEVVTLNSSGGIAAGDRLSGLFSVACGARVTITTQAAERFYRARAGENSAVVENRIEIERGAAVEWLPQETIFFDGTALSRRLHVELAPGAEFLGVEMLVFGRALMGETVRQLRLRDGLRIVYDGRPLLHDVVRIEGDAAALLSRPGIAGGMRAVATLLYVAADASARLEALREALQDAEAGASVDGDLLVARVLAPSGAELRRLIETALLTLRRRPLPRVWLC
jgi:urease accessory protein